MRRILSLLVIVTGLLTSCKQTSDTIVAEAFHHKLYLSELVEKLPHNVSKEDSLLFMEQYVEEWILRQTLLAHAKQKLTQREQNFSSQIEQYKEQLLMEAYLKKISRDEAQFEVSKGELADFLHEKTDDTPEYRDMVRLNYIKISNPSKLYKQIKELFFDDKNRVKAIKQLELICADTIEYYLDGEHWFYIDILENELPFSFSEKENTDLADKFDFVVDEYRYLLIILDKKKQLQPKNSYENRQIAQALLEQQKKAEFFNNFKDSLVQKALLEKKVIRYPINAATPQ